MMIINISLIVFLILIQTCKKIYKELKKMLKLTRKRFKTASEEEKIIILEEINRIENTFKEIKEGEHKKRELYTNACNKAFFNPGCKGTIFENDPKLVNDFYIKTNADYLRKEGANSGCIIKPFYL